MESVYKIGFSNGVSDRQELEAFCFMAMEKHVKFEKGNKEKIYEVTSRVDVRYSPQWGVYEVDPRSQSRLAKGVLEDKILSRRSERGGRIYGVSRVPTTLHYACLIDDADDDSTATGPSNLRE
ncbi:hypothetical protein PIB30_082915 [Stylosanthes scabra]|uniref:Uncharacterized protein n=1 Tax=Stylosanthes scabra TaxID=79078 RepID=A0ABU6UUR8_9FABA|nr:hypothetical protein [Stylosanthes scabra]